MTAKPLDEHVPNTHHHNKINLSNQRADVVQWRCLNCGQHIFVVVDIAPPDTCEYCKDMTTWQFVER